MFRNAQRGSHQRSVRAGIVIGTTAIALFTAPMYADLVEDVDIVVPGDAGQFEVDVQFIDSSAGWSGDFYFLGSGSSDAVEDYADNSNDRELGQWLLNNHSSTAGDTATLNGTFSAGEVLHFAYDVWKNGNHQDLFRTDVEDDLAYFQWDSESFDLGIEDIRGDGSDWDFNDMEVKFTFREVPTPATAAIMLLAGIAGRSGRRRA